MLTEAMPKGWVGWAQQATELHTFCADHENGTKAEHGFFNLCHKSIAAVREDLVTDYQALADQHSEEIAHILEYGATELEIVHQLHKQSKQWNSRTILKRRRDQPHKTSWQHHLSANLR